MLFLLGSVFKEGAFRRGGTKRKSSRNKCWSRSAQKLFASWAVIGQIGSIGVLVSETLELQLAKVQIINIEQIIAAFPGNYVTTESCKGPFAIGLGATASSYLIWFALGLASKATVKYLQELGVSATAAATNAQVFSRQKIRNKIHLSLNKQVSSMLRKKSYSLRKASFGRSEEFGKYNEKVWY